MIIINSLSQIKTMPKTAVALGNFDGVHKGHQALIKGCVEYAKESGLSSCVFTFSNHPANEIAGRPVIKKILSQERKEAYLESIGLDYLVSVPFDERVRTCSPERFIKEILVNMLNMSAAFCGFNYNFGYMAQGTPEMLTDFGAELGYKVFVHDPVIINGNTVSSTLIRGLIDSGRMNEFEVYTGYPYEIDGTVIKGEHMGRRMGYPTANLSLEESMAFPANGVYITRTAVDGSVYPSVTNVGVKPTVGQFNKNAETHIFDFHNDIYGKQITVQFIKMLREERCFDGMEALSIQIDRDCMDAREYHRKNG